jgi:pimeloyl-ACP methyl ester carboxylesterase
MKIDIQRIIGLKIFNSIGEHKYDSLPVLFFNLPDGMPINKYSYRSNESMAPDDYKKGLNAINKPLLVIVGSNDEAFVASAFESAVTNNSNGKVIVIDGADHNSIIYNTKAFEFIKEWMTGFNLKNTTKR